MLKRNAKLINKKFYQYLIPSILTIFAMQIASLLDGIIVGNLLGNDALTATSLVLPILYIVQTPGLALGVGGSIVVGILLGKRDVVKANKAFSACLIYGVLIASIFAALAPAISMPLATLFSSSLVDYSYQYIFIYLVTDPIITISVLIASFMMVDNNPKLSSFFYIFSMAIKIGSMFLFILVFQMGMYGAALSTGFGYLVGLLSIIVYVKSNKRLLKFTLKIKGTFGDLKEALKASSATAINLILTAIQMCIINIIISNVLTDGLDIIIFGLVANMVFVFDLFSGGILGLIPTICGILYGEKDIYSLKAVVRKIYILNIIITALLTVLVLIIPNVYSMMFGFQTEDQYELERTAFMIRIYLISFLPYEINKFSTNYYPSIEKNVPSYVTVFLRELILVIPLNIALVYTNGLFGYVLAQALTEGLTVIITYIFVILYGKIKNKGRGIFLFEKYDFDSYDISLDNDINNAAVISKEITDFALAHGASNHSAQIIGLASEEFVANIISYGYKINKENYIDVNLKIIDDNMVLRIRDDGMPFDPTKYDVDDGIEYSTSGINMINKLTNKISYMRVLSLNNTVIEMSKQA